MQKLFTVVVVVALALVTSGCLSVCRLCKSDRGGYREWSEKRQEWVWHKCEPPASEDIVAKLGLYPTMKMRWQLARMSWHWAPKKRRWGQRVGIPFALLALTPGMVVDAVVDTVAIPWDWKYRDAEGIDMCAPLDEERKYRSLCAICGATSDGEFARCRKTADRNTENWRKYYGVCPACIERAEAAGYDFE